MIFDVPWSLPRNKETLKDFNWGIAPLPAGPDGKATNTGDEFLTMQIDRVLAEAIEKPIIGNNEPRKALKYTAAEADKILQSKDL